jgi:hypothetical protein
MVGEKYISAARIVIQILKFQHLRRDGREIVNSFTKRRS